jgi:hypothetical protein
MSEYSAARIRNRADENGEAECTVAVAREDGVSGDQVEDPVMVTDPGGSPVFNSTPTPGFGAAFSPIRPNISPKKLAPFSCNLRIKR